MVRRTGRNRLSESIENLTIEQVLSQTANDKNYSSANRYTLIRQNGGRIARDFKLIKQCFCGYNKHVQLCHKISISEFPKNTLISIVNSPDNLVFLCPNHHWELDHNLLSVEEMGVLGFQPKINDL